MCWDSLVAHRTKRWQPGGVESSRGWYLLVMPRTKRWQPGGVERGWYLLVMPRTKGWQSGGVERCWASLVAHRTKKGPGGVNNISVFNSKRKVLTVNMYMYCKQPAKSYYKKVCVCI